MGAAPMTVPVDTSKKAHFLNPRKMPGFCLGVLAWGGVPNAMYCKYIVLGPGRRPCPGRVVQAIVLVFTGFIACPTPSASL